MCALLQQSDWPADRVAEARAVIADVAHHSDHLIRLACNVLAAHGETDGERKDGLGPVDLAAERGAAEPSADESL